ncbi:UDP-N-acetylmuramoyl-L-alanyl-D-glutamate--2,6-diaminopimelate ligase [Amphibacillus cookii]|uniref:UDP-N-acetylmuramoyl-L-alanyl-D-glutamate--2, 6-diaminopimelate ligase n=1 Tax=Amphibacillus cookii TaxID=767787 RepID=UPI001EF7749A|nr:UDP-N-acetylmuramoyl-L-alanyl-D-glutamate--2,6-diaminopimelate ligase [Amphibacillus cookii]MBM7540475.1 UDP-N-acetylmuramoyl-L-alanyl-D-glutamate--2,6-diaminopimelate ligase [Amphibacillus cookii]
MKKLKAIIDDLPFPYRGSHLTNRDIKDIKIDSRAVQADDLFVCISGYTVDGHDFVKQAVDKGAVAIIAEKTLAIDTVPVIYVKDTKRVLSYLASYFYDHPSNDVHLIGITGTNGKTSVSYLLDEIFTLAKQKTAVIGTIQMKIADTIYPIANTTPEPSYLQKSFKQMVDTNIDHCMMEVSSHALELGRVNGCDFDLAIFTNLSQDHLDFHETMDDYLKAKLRLFYQLGNRYQQSRPKYAVINGDDRYANDFAHASSQPVITYGLTDMCDIYADQIQFSANGTIFNLHTLEGTVEIKTDLIGKFNVYNMLAAASAAQLSGVTLATIKQGLEQSKGVRGRFETVKGDHPFGIIIDYAHTPDSLENVLATIQSFAQAKIYLVIGCGGDRDRTKRPLMAAIGEKYADFTILTSDNPRSEDPLEIIEDMREGMESNRYKIEIDRKQAIKHAVSLAAPNDIILIAGKGHETYQIIGDQTIHFDDYQVALQALSEGR